MLSWCKELGVRFRSVPTLFAVIPHLDNGLLQPEDLSTGNFFHKGGQDALQYRVRIEDAIFPEVEELSLAKRDDMETANPVSRSKFPGFLRCAAGLRSLAIDPYGYVYPCQMFSPREEQHVQRHSLRHIWEVLIPGYRRLGVDEEDYPCSNCAVQFHCLACAPTIAAESGDPTKPTTFLCRIARHRSKVLSKIS